MKFVTYLFLCLLASCATFDPTSIIMKYSQAKYDTESTPAFDAIYSEEYKKQFKETICQKKTKEACDSELLSAFTSRLETYYKYADWDSVLQICKANPVECKSDYRFLEKASITSHNSNLDKAMQREIASEKQRLEAAQQAQWAAFGQAMQVQEENRQEQLQQQQLIQELRRPVQTNCSTFGNSTRCTSY